MIPLFAAYPELAAGLPHTTLALRPTPVEQAAQLGDSLGLDALYIKRDDQSGAIYGGNKVRKLEFLLGDALRRRSKAVLTFGGAGSNHALATALYARQLGLKSISLLGEQPNAHSVRRNLLMGYKAGAELHYYGNGQRMAQGVQYHLMHQRMRSGFFPMVIPPGGSSPLGTLGFVDAVFELRDQIAAGLLPEPDYIYAACGTMGTVTGLLAGVCAAGLKSQLMAIAVTDPPYTDLARGRILFDSTVQLLHQADPAFPAIPFPEARFILRKEFKGERYGLYTPQSVEAVRMARDLAGLKIEGTYTGKAFSAVIADAASGGLAGKTVLFWNTYNSRDFSSEIAGLDYHQLPVPFRAYFEQEVQPLDREVST